MLAETDQFLLLQTSAPNVLWLDLLDVKSVIYMYFVIILGKYETKNQTKVKFLNFQAHTNFAANNL